MAFQYLNNRPLDEARTQYLALLQEQGFTPRSETIPVQSAGGRITARAVYAHICAPHYPACAMDGIAVSAADTFGASDTTPISLTPEQYTVVDTGDPLPEERDAVIMVEEVVFAAGQAIIHQAATPWQHVRQIGEDICAGEMLLPGHMSVSPAAIDCRYYPHRGRGGPSHRQPKARGCGGVQLLHLLGHARGVGCNAPGLSHRP